MQGPDGKTITDFMVISPFEKMGEGVKKLGETTSEAKEHIHEFSEAFPPEKRNKRSFKEIAKAKQKRKAAKQARKTNR